MKRSRAACAVMVLFTLLLAWPGLCRGQGASPQGAALLAVIDRTTLPLPGLKADEHRYLVGRIYSWAEQRLGNRVRVMTEQNTFTLLQDMGINPADCVQQDCEVAIGRKIGADWLIVIKIYRFDERSPFIFELGLYQTGSGAFHGAQEARGQSTIELSDRAREAADKLFDKLLEKLGGVARAETAQLTFLMEPGPVFMLRNGLAIGTLTVPASGRLRLDTAPGSHDFVFSREGKEDVRISLEADPARPREIEVQFQPGRPEVRVEGSGKGLLRVASEPRGATVHLDDVEVGTTTLQLPDVAAGSHRVRLSKPLYKTREVDVAVAEDAVAEVSEILAPDFAPLEILSEPAGASVWVDGQERGRTPWRVERFPAGRSALRLRLDLHHDLEDVLTVEAGQPLRLSLSLQPAFGSLRVESQPPGAQVFVDEEEWGAAPVARDRVRSGRHTVRVRADLYNDYESWVEVQDGGSHTVRADLSADYGTLRLAGSPAGARVLVDGAYRGVLPIDLRLPPGQHRLRVEEVDHDVVEEDITVAVGEERDRRLDLVRQTGGLRILVEPPDAIIHLDGLRLGPSPQVVKELPTGRHQVRASLAEHADHSRSVTIRRGVQEQVDITLSRAAWLEYRQRRLKATLGSLVVPGGGQLAARQPRGLVYLLGAAGGIALAVDSWQRHDRLERDYEEARHHYASSLDEAELNRHYADMEAAWDGMKRQRDLHWAGVGLAGVAWLAGVADGWLLGGGSRDTGAEQHSLGGGERTWEARLQPARRTLGVALAIRW
jgi:hypothetical protein